MQLPCSHPASAVARICNSVRPRIHPSVVCYCSAWIQFRASVVGCRSGWNAWWVEETKMEPESSSSQQAGPTVKFLLGSTRCQDRLPHWLSLRENSSKAISVLLYVWSWRSPRRNLRAVGAQSVRKIWGFATNLLCFYSAFSLHMLLALSFLGPPLQSVQLSSELV